MKDIVLSGDKPDKPAPECTCLHIRRTSLAVSKLYDGFLAPSGLNNSQFSLLRHIDRFGPASVSDLAAKMQFDRTTLVRNLKAVEREGWVADLAGKGNRNRRLVLTEKGKAVYTDAERLWRRAQEHLEQTLGQEDMNALQALLSKVEALATEH